MLSTPGVRTHVGTDSKTVKYRWQSVRTPQNLFDRMKNFKAIFRLCCDGICFRREHV